MFSYLLGYLSNSDVLLIGKFNRTADGNFIFAPLRPGVKPDDLFISSIHYGSEFSNITKSIFDDLAPNCLKSIEGDAIGKTVCCEGVEGLYKVLA